MIYHKSGLCDDKAGHILRRGTCIIVLLAVLFTVYSQNRSSPFKCYVPQEFTPDWAKYTDNVCWNSKKFTLPKNTNLPSSISKRGLEYSNKMRCLPYVLLLSLVWLHLPTGVWWLINRCFPVDANQFVSTAANADRSGVDMRSRAAGFLANQMRRFSSNINIFILYIIYKAHTALSCVILLLSLLYFVYEHLLWSGDASVSLGSRLEDHGFEAFPSVFLCELGLNKRGNLHFFKLQCSLLHSNFYNIIMAVLCVWVSLNFLTTIFACVVTCITVCVPLFRESFFRRLLFLDSRSQKNECASSHVERMIKTFSVDVALLLQLTEASVSSDIVSTILEEAARTENEMEDGLGGAVSIHVEQSV